jgi:hypothetical protein
MRLRRLAVSLTVAMLGLAGCAHHQPAYRDAPETAQVTPVPGTDLHRVTLTGEAMRQLGIATEPTRAAKAPAGARSTPTAIPVTAVIYDPEGASWAYTVPEPRTFVRGSIVIDHIDGDDAILTSGPPLGTPVVTVGAAELLGVEYGVGEE